jgi:hypothetical protein
MANNNALDAVYALPIKQRNPYPRRGSSKHARSANINRNVRTHLARTSNDIKMVANNYNGCRQNTTNTMIPSILFVVDFTSLSTSSTSGTLIANSSFMITFLSFRWKTYNTARSIIIAATKGRFLLVKDATVDQMSDLLS